MIEDKLYLSIANHLLSQAEQDKIKEKGLSEISHIDLYENQPTRENEEMAYSLPAVFIDFSDSQAEDDSVMRQETYTLFFHIESRKSGSSAMNSHNQTISLDNLRLMNLVRISLQKYVYEGGVSRLEYVGRRLDQKGNNVVVHILEFSITVNMRVICD